MNNSDLVGMYYCIKFDKFINELEDISSEDVCFTLEISSELCKKCSYCSRVANLKWLGVFKDGYFTELNN